MRNESEEILLVFRCAQLLPHSVSTAPVFHCEGMVEKHACSYPKDGELYLSRVKSGETLMEARSDTDVQIVRQTCV